jgi:hypothetical protein
VVKKTARGASSPLRFFGGHIPMSLFVTEQTVVCVIRYYSRYGNLGKPLKQSSIDTLGGVQDG